MLVARKGIAMVASRGLVEITDHRRERITQWRTSVTRTFVGVMSITKRVSPG